MSKISALPAADAFSGDETVVLVQDGATRRGGIGGLVQAAVLPFVDQAEEAAMAAMASASAAAIDRKVYGSTISGLAATLVGEFFFTPGEAGDESLILWRHDTGPVATKIDALPSAAMLSRLEEAEQIMASRASAAALGVDPDADNMGIFGGIIPDNATAKQALHALEAAVADGVATNAVAIEFEATQGQTEFIMPFALNRTPAVSWNGVEQPRSSYSYEDEVVAVAFDVRAGDIVKIAVSDAIDAAVHDIVGPFSLRDLSPGMQPVAPGIYFGQGGNALSFETLISSPSDGADTDNQRALMLLVAKTTDDGNSEEQTLCLLTTIETGYGPQWAPGTAYTLGQNVRRTSINNVYRCIKAGTSGATGPTGKAAYIVDGSCIWTWINDDAINAKASIYNEVLVKEGGTQAWAQANNMMIRPGYMGGFLANTELDLTNDCGIDTVFGGLNKYNLYMITDGANRSTASIGLTSRNTEGYAAFWALHISGHKHAENSVIGIDSSSQHGLGFGVIAGGAETPTFAHAAITDGSNAQMSYDAAGSYSAQAISVSGSAPAAISLSGNFSGWLIYSSVFEIDRLGNLKARSIAFTELPPSYADDAAAGAAGVGIGGTYRTGSTLKIRTA